MRLRLPRALFLLPLLVLPLSAGGGTRTARALATITEPEVRSHVEFLASDELEGRGTGSPGFDAAARYVATRIDSWGLKPMGDDGSWFQKFKAGRGKNEKATQNVCGLVEGTDPALKSEVVVLGAHLDHVGTGQIMGAMGGRGQIHNGADDNASGSSAILELAEAFSRFPPRRSVLFLWFAGEEMGCSARRTSSGTRRSRSTGWSR
jgi:acetylornithine deacetylase/succinyl-diaminopimelate desuccinylase-like protein